MNEVMWISGEADKATAGSSICGWSASGVSIDTRTLEKGDLFVALSGDSSDGHDYLEEAFSRGASAALVDRIPEGFEDKPLLVVNDVLKGLEDLAIFRRSQCSGKIIGITGSVGKTSVKEGVAMVLSEIGRTHSSSGNFNNHIGLPLSLARMPKNVDFGVFELGMSGPLEISSLSKILTPDVSVVTNVRGMHLEFFDSIEQIAHAKAEIFEGMKGGVAILPFDDKYYEILKEKAELSSAASILSVGRGIKSNILLNKENTSFSGQDIGVVFEGADIEYSIKALGEHQAINSAIIVAVMLSLGVDMAKVVYSISGYDAAKGRGKIYDVKYAGKSFKIIDDSYNAGPDSMRAAFLVLSKLKDGGDGRTIALLGDMLELGDKADEFHRDLSQDIVDNNVDKIFTAGKHMKSLHCSLPDEKKGGHYDMPEDLLDEFSGYVENGDIVLIKGSNGSKMWKLVKILTGEK